MNAKDLKKRITALNVHRKVRDSLHRSADGMVLKRFLAMSEDECGNFFEMVENKEIDGDNLRLMLDVWEERQDGEIDEEAFEKPLTPKKVQSVSITPNAKPQPSYTVVSTPPKTLLSKTTKVQKITPPELFGTVPFSPNPTHQCNFTGTESVTYVQRLIPKTPQPPYSALGKDNAVQIGDIWLPDINECLDYGVEDLEKVAYRYPFLGYNVYVLNKHNALKQTVSTATGKPSVVDIDMEFSSNSPSDQFFFFLWAINQCQDLNLRLVPEVAQWVEKHVVLGAVIKPYMALLHPHKGTPSQFLTARKAYTESVKPQTGRLLLYQRAGKPPFTEGIQMKCPNCPVLNPTYFECRTCPSLGYANLSNPKRYNDKELSPLVQNILMNDDTAVYVPEPQNAETITALAHFLSRVWKQRTEVLGISEIIRRSNADTLAETPVLIVYGASTENQLSTVRSAATSRAFSHRRTIVLTREGGNRNG